MPSKTFTGCLALSGLLVACTPAIREIDDDERVLTRKFGPDDLQELARELMRKLELSAFAMTPGQPRVAVAEIRNHTDQPGLNKQPIFDVIESSISRMGRFVLIDHRETQKLMEEAGYQQTDLFDSGEAVKLGRAVRARFLIWGDVSLQSDIMEDASVLKQYRLSLKITDVETHRVVFRETATTRKKAVR